MKKMTDWLFETLDSIAALRIFLPTSCHHRIDKALTERISQMRNSLKQDRFDVRVWSSWESEKVDDPEQVTSCGLCGVTGKETRKGLCQPCFESLVSAKVLGSRNFIEWKKDILYTICLDWSFEGTSEYFYIYYDGKRISRIKYVHNDGLDSAVRWLHGEEYEDARKFFKQFLF